MRAEALWRASVSFVDQRGFDCEVNQKTEDVMEGTAEGDRQFPGLKRSACFRGSVLHQNRHIPQCIEAVILKNFQYPFLKQGAVLDSFRE